jgi:hypothetical protein
MSVLFCLVIAYLKEQNLPFCFQGLLLTELLFSYREKDLKNVVKVKLMLCLMTRHLSKC